MTLRTTLTFLTLSWLMANGPAAVNGARILGFFPSPSPSHLIIHCAIADALAAAGHNVTVIAPTKNFYANAKYEYIQTNSPIFSKSFLNNLVNNPEPFYKRTMANIYEGSRLANITLSNTIVKQFLAAHGPGSFDVIILGYFFNDFHLALGLHFQCPIILSFMFHPIFTLQKLLGNPIESAYVPTLFSGLKQPLNFWGRLQNYANEIYETYGLQTVLDTEVQKYYDYNFPSDRYPPLNELRKQHISLLFSNHHFSEGPIRPNVPGIIEIGGIQIKEKTDRLPSDIANILDNSTEGVIYVSLGTNVQGTYLIPEKTKIMFDIVSKLPYTVLWKWGDSGFPGQSSNIIYKSWLPQDDLLAHPNIKLFITHGGMGSTLESEYHGVPMVGIPLFFDQFANVAKMERCGYGLSVEYISMTKAGLSNAIQEVLYNPKYTEAVRNFSKIYRDRPLSARQSVVYWTEYVVRHKGAKHLQSPAVHLNRWQLMSLDLYAFLTVIALTVAFVLIKLFKLLCGRKKEISQVGNGKKNK